MDPTEQYTANVIAEQMYAQVDSSYTLRSWTRSDHKKNVGLAVGTIGILFRKRPQVNEKNPGWQFCVQCVEETGARAGLVDLKDLKSQSVDVAEYAVSNKLVCPKTSRMVGPTPFTLKRGTV
jgi:hypothetical protein